MVTAVPGLGELSVYFFHFWSGDQTLGSLVHTRRIHHVKDECDNAKSGCKNLIQPKGITLMKSRQIN